MTDERRVVITGIGLASPIGNTLHEATVALQRGEHGVGVEKLGEMCVQFNDEERAQFHRVREAFDPGRLLNPGKAIPTLARCAEHNAMHVHRGKVPFPDIERF